MEINRLTVKAPYTRYKDRFFSSQAEEKRMRMLGSTYILRDATEPIYVFDIDLGKDRLNELAEMFSTEGYIVNWERVLLGSSEMIDNPFKDTETDKHIKRILKEYTYLYEKLEDYEGHKDHKDHEDHEGHKDHKDHEDHEGHKDHEGDEGQNMYIIIKTKKYTLESIGGFSSISSRFSPYPLIKRILEVYHFNGYAPDYIEDIDINTAISRHIITVEYDQVQGIVGFVTLGLKLNIHTKYEVTVREGDLSTRIYTVNGFHNTFPIFQLGHEPLDALDPDEDTFLVDGADINISLYGIN